MKYSKVLIIGAPRSGTNILRDILTKKAQLKTWPCDEINYIWRYGNAYHPNDVLKTKNLTPEIKLFINSAFDNIAKKTNAQFILEKTCANSLRVPYVNKILPDAKYLFIRRNGFDAISSAILKWQSSPDLKYILKKAKYVPIKDIPFYSSKFFLNSLHKFFSKEKRMGFWGPRFENCDKILNNYSLIETVAFQWRECINKGFNDLRNIPNKNFLEIEYDDFVLRPNENVQNIYNFLEIDINKEMISSITKSVRKNSIGLGLKSLKSSEIDLINPIVEKTMKFFNYLI